MAGTADDATPPTTSTGMGAYDGAATRRPSRHHSRRALAVTALAGDQATVVEVQAKLLTALAPPLLEAIVERRRAGERP